MGEEEKKMSAGILSKEAAKAGTRGGVSSAFGDFERRPC